MEHTYHINELNDQERKNKAYDLLLDLSQAIAGARNRADLWHVVTDQLLEIFGARYYTLCLINEDGETHAPFLHSQAQTIVSRTGESPIIHDRHPKTDGIFNVAFEAKEPVVFLLSKLMKRGDAPKYIFHWYNAGIKEMVVTSIHNGKEAKGVLYLYAKEEGSFQKEQFSLLTSVAGLLGTGISNILANEKIEAQLEEIKSYKQQLERENVYLKEEQQKESGRGIIGNSEGIKKVEQLISRVSGADATVLISGETGTGKELAARAIHEQSPRSKHLMIKVNCAAMPASLMESELFGHEKGAFTGAVDRRIGKFELADNGTLFLDEIGELPLELQSKLLRALQEKEIERVGGNSSIKINVRIIAATNRDLEKEVAAGRFRADLYYRLNVFPIALPPLRQRTEDIPALTQFFIAGYGKNAGKKITGISNKALEQLMAYAWPGNIRELEHLIERTVLLHNGAMIDWVDLPQPGKANVIPVAADWDIRPLDDVERDHILKALRVCKGRVSGPNGAAVRLGMPPTTLISKMQRLGIKKEHLSVG